MSDSSNSDSAGVRIFPPAVFLGGLLVGYVLHWFWPVPIASPAWSLVVRIVGIAIALLGFAIMFAALAAFQRAGTPPAPWEPTTKLTFEGPYRFTRNPMYFGMGLILGGLALAGNALWPLIALVPVIAIIRTQVIAREEHYLSIKFGEAYREYKARVRRWI